MTTAGGVVLGAGAIGGGSAGRPRLGGSRRRRPKPAAATASSPESLVKVLYDTLSPKQREAICFAWDHQDPKRGLLRTRVANNWNITDYYIIDDDFYTKDQQDIIRGIFEGIINPEWHARIDKQLDDDCRRLRRAEQHRHLRQAGQRSKFEFVMTGRHMTIRCDGNSAEHVAFGGPIFYGHAADGFNEGPTHPGNVFWPQAQAANKLYQMLDGKQREQALVRQRPAERSSASASAARTASSRASR